MFGNFILADEINRAPAKVQSALLEAMQERQVTLGDHHAVKLADPFLVLATQNPIEQEGTYPLPEAQLDRFMLKIKVGYPTKEDEVKIIDRMAGAGAEPTANKIMGTATRSSAARDVVKPDLRRRQGQALRGRPGRGDPRSQGRRAWPQLAPLIDNGASRARARSRWSRSPRRRRCLSGRTYMSPHDIKTIAHDVLRHRVLVELRGRGAGQGLGSS